MYPAIAIDGQIWYFTHNIYIVDKDVDMKDFIRAIYLHNEDGERFIPGTLRVETHDFKMNKYICFLEKDTGKIFFSDHGEAPDIICKKKLNTHRSLKEKPSVILSAQETGFSMDIVARTRVGNMAAPCHINDGELSLINPALVNSMMEKESVSKWAAKHGVELPSIEQEPIPEDEPGFG